MRKNICLLLIGCMLLCGCGQTAAPTEPVYEAQQPTLSPTEPTEDAQILAYRRQIVADEMRRIMGTLWTPAQDISYYLKSPEVYPEDYTEPLTLKAGRIYQGVPYTHGTGSGYGFFTYATGQDENGIYTIDGLTSVHLTGESRDIPGANARQGNDCADAVFWSWARISDSIRFRFTGEMTEAYGVLKVGDYVCNLPRLTTSTKAITKSNGQETMFTSYAQLQMGDAMVLYTNSSGGHAVMVVDMHVEYTDGKIDGEKSYVVIIEQNSAAQRADSYYYNEEIGQNVYICGGYELQWSFDTIYTKGYLPVTCKELVDPSPLTEQSASLSNKVSSLESLYTATINATHRIAYVTVTICKDGQTVQKATAYGRQTEMTSFSMLAFVSPTEQQVLQGSLDPKALSPGEYTCTVSCRLSTGNTQTVADFQFTK